jgi:PiT family inorganic phosphate transporter
VAICSPPQADPRHAYRKIPGGNTIEPILLILLGAGAYVGWNIGANDTANCIGTSVGCGLISFKKAVFLVGVFTVLGAMLQGQHVMKTIGKGIVRGDLNYTAIIVALLCSGFFVTLATFYRIPTSTSQAVVGGVFGIGLAIGADVNYAKFIIIAESWLICPVLVMALAYISSHLLNFITRRIALSALLIQNAIGWLAILSACYVAYSMGANNAGNAVGPIANLGIIDPALLLMIGGIAIAVGAITYGKKVAETVGKGITPLDIPAAFVAQFASAVGLHLFSVLGIPVSTSSAIVGAVVGVGLVKGAKAISRKTVITILLGWILTPCSAAVSSFVLYKAIAMLTG